MIAFSRADLTHHALTPASPLRRDIDRQPGILATVWSRASQFRTLAREHLKPGLGGRLFVCGCGDGLFAAQAASAYAESLGLDWRAIGALDLLLSDSSLRPADRVIAISMSGNVDRTVEMAQGAAGVDASMDLASIGAAQSAALAAADVGIGQIPLPSGVRLLAAGAERGTVRYSAAKFVELTRIPAWSADLEEFAHSQYWAMPASDLVVIVSPEPRMSRYADDSCDALRGLGVTTLAIDTVGSPVPRATWRITVPQIDVALMPLVTALPLQLLAAHLARASGLDPDRRLHLKNDEARFRVSRMLTRRSLLGTGQ